MPGFAIADTIQNQQAFFSDSQLHFRWLAYNSPIYFAKDRQQQFDPVLTRDLFFSRRRQYKIV